MTIRVLIADDQSMVRARFRMLLAGEQDMEVVAEASNGLEAVAMAARVNPTVILMDIRMPELDGLQATRRILAADNTAWILILTTFGLDEYIYEALSAGASGFVLKDDPPEQLIEAVRTVAAGDALLSPAITKRVINQFTRIPSSRAAERTRRAHRTRARHPPAHRPRPVQRRDRRGALHQRDDRQDPRLAHPPETRTPRPRPSRRARIPDRARTGRHAHLSLTGARKRDCRRSVERRAPDQLEVDKLGAVCRDDALRSLTAIDVGDCTIEHAGQLKLRPVHLLLEDESRIGPRDEREWHSRPTTPPGPVVTVRGAGSTAFSAGPKEGIVMKAKRIYSPSRIVALVVIGVMLFGLAYIGFAPGDAAVSVPARGARRPARHPRVHVHDQKGAMPTDCGTLVVPENRASWRPRLIALPVIRILARSSHPVGANLPPQRRPRRLPT